MVIFFNRIKLFIAVSRLIILPIALTSFMNAYGQRYNFKNYSIENGLPQSTVFCVAQDIQGFLWVGTESGAARFDGNSFELYDINRGLAGNSVRSIVSDAKGSLWFGTNNGITVYDGNGWTTINEKKGLKGSVITKLLPDSLGRMWAATNDAGVNIISTKNDSLHIINIDSKQGLPSDFVFDIKQDTKGKTWLALIGGLSVVEFKDEELKVFNVGDSILLPSQYISSIDIDIDQNIWLGTLDAGAFLWDRKKGEFKDYNRTNGITDERIWDVFCDDDGSVWFATEKSGVFYFKEGVFKNISEKNGLLGSQIFSLFKDNNRNLWLGSVGQGLSMFQGFQLVHYSVNDGLPGNSVLAVKTDVDDNLWIGANQQGLAKANFVNDKLNVQHFSSINGYFPDDITSIDFDNRGNVLAGTRGNGLLVKVGSDFHYIKQSDGLLDNNINCVYNAKAGSIYVGSDMGFNEIAGQQIHSIAEEQGLINPEVQTVIADKDNNIYMGTMGGLAKFQAKTSVYRDFNEEEGLFDLSIHTMVVDKNNAIWIGTNNGIYIYSQILDTITQFTQVKLNSKTVNSLLFLNDSILIVGTIKGFDKITFNASLTKVLSINSYDKTNGFISSETNFNAICSDAKHQVWFGTVNGLTVYRPYMEDTLIETPKVQLLGIRLSFDNINWQANGYNKIKWNNIPQNLILPYDENHITFDFVGIHFNNPEKVVFKYKLLPNEDKWSPITNNTSATYAGISNGKFKFLVTASSDGVIWSEPLVYDFKIEPPFWKRIWFFVLVIALIIGAFVLYINWRERKLLKEKAYLEKVVRERTAKVVAQKEEIEKQKEEITGSITYAQRIQRAILPGFDNLKQNTVDCFILFKPRDIVSGDYYWIERINNSLVVAAADCTGHGVPGAFMSMLGISFMNKIVKEQKVDSPDRILGQMRKNVIESLKQGCHEGSTKDGMDMAVAIVNLETLIMNFAGAYNAAIVISEGEANELKADRMPVGYHIKMDDYTATKVQLKKGDCIYMYSDGFQDQIGGPKERKFMRKNMRELLIEIHSLPFTEQKNILNTTITNWMNHPDGITEQMDDILVLGFKI